MNIKPGFPVKITNPYIPNDSVIDLTDMFDNLKNQFVRIYDHELKARFGYGSAPKAHFNTDVGLGSLPPPYSVEYTLTDEESLAALSVLMRGGDKGGTTPFGDITSTALCKVVSWAVYRLRDQLTEQAKAKKDFTRLDFFETPLSLKTNRKGAEPIYVLVYRDHLDTYPTLRIESSFALS